MNTTTSLGWMIARRKWEYKKILSAYPDAPVHILDGINRYVEHRLRPGSFLTAVLSNDLAGAFNTADTDAEAGLPDIIKYIHWEIPSLCWGSRAKVEAWLEEEYEGKGGETVR